MGVAVLTQDHKFFYRPSMEKCGFITSPIESGEFVGSGIMWPLKLS